MRQEYEIYHVGPDDKTNTSYNQTVKERTKKIINTRTPAWDLWR